MRLRETGSAEDDAGGVVVHCETDSFPRKGRIFIIQLGVVEMPGSSVGDGELVRRRDFGEPSIHEEGVFLQAVFRYAGALANSLNAVDFVQDSLGD